MANNISFANLSKLSQLTISISSDLGGEPPVPPTPPPPIERTQFIYKTSNNIPVSNQGFDVPYISNVFDEERGVCIMSFDPNNKPTKTNNRAFQSTNITDVLEFPDSVIELSNDTFRSAICNTMVLPRYVQRLGCASFIYNKFSEIEIPSTCTLVDDDCFYSCTNLNKITCNATTAPALAQWFGYTAVFHNVQAVGDLIVPIGSDYSTWYAMLPSGWQK